MPLCEVHYRERSSATPMHLPLRRPSWNHRWCEKPQRRQSRGLLCNLRDLRDRVLRGLEQRARCCVRGHSSQASLFVGLDIQRDPLMLSSSPMPWATRPRRRLPSHQVAQGMRAASYLAVVSWIVGVQPTLSFLTAPCLRAHRRCGSTVPVSSEKDLLGQKL